MPKIPIDYSKAIVYLIECKTDPTLNYIGSTTNYIQRNSQHKTSVNSQNKHNYLLYKTIRENGGWDNWVMRPIKEFPCETKIQLLIEENKMIKEIETTLNKRNAVGCSRAEYRETHKKEYNTYAKKWREGHKEEERKRHCEYYATHYESKKDKYNETRRAKYAEKKLLSV